MESEKYPEQLVFGLDIGTRSIVGTVGYRTGKQFIVVAQSVREHETRAMIDGQIHDIEKVSETIREVKKELEEQLDIVLTEVCIAAAGRVLKTVKVTAEYEFASETTVNEDHIRSLDLMGVEKAYSTLRADLKKSKINFYCVGYSVINYSLNGYTMFKLNGHKANRIGTDILATFLPDEVINGLYAAVESAELQVASLTLEPIAAINVAIPENYRLLNIAMVDVGAGTSDISITKDGSIIAYGMIPNAGDEITEAIAEKYLVDFTVAEKIKTSCLRRKTVSFKNIMGTGYKLSTDEVIEAVSEIVHRITKNIAEKIIELNGNKSVSAVFVVGGGGKIPGFIENLAQYLKLPQERVALRGEDVLKSVTFLQKQFKKDSLMVTPIGICLNYYDNNNNFIFVSVNGERIKLYDNGKLAISDAAVQLGYTNEELFPKRGKPLNFLLNGASRTMKGEFGEAASIRLNGETAGINHEIKHNDIIEIIESTAGKAAEYDIRQLPEYKNSITFHVNGSKIQCPKLVLTKGEMVSEYYSIKEKDEITILNYYTLKQILEFMDISFQGQILVNGESADRDHKIYENDTVEFSLKEEKETPPTNQGNSDSIHKPTPREVKPKEPEIPSINKFCEATPYKAVTQQQNSTNTAQQQEISSDWFMLKPKDSAKENTVKQNSIVNNLEYNQIISTENTDFGQKEPSPSMPNTLWGYEVKTQNPSLQNFVKQESNQTQSIGTKPKDNQSQEVYITVNGKVVKLSNKLNYIFVDILDFYPFDLSSMKGSELVTLLNGDRVDFTAPIKDKDNAEIFWK